MNSEIEETTIYIIKHISSASKAQVRFGLDKNKNPKLLSVQMLSGKVISLQGIKKALKQLQTKNNLNNNELA